LHAKNAEPAVTAQRLYHVRFDFNIPGPAWQTRNDNLGAGDNPALDEPGYCTNRIRGSGRSNLVLTP
jgi:hypothetical protein